MHNLRCGSTLHGRMMDATTLEVRCKRRACGAAPGVIVLHRFNIASGDLINTKKYADPRKELANGAKQSVTSIRAS